MQRLVLEFREARKFPATAGAHGGAQLPGKIAEEQKGLGRGPFLAHEQHRYLRQQQIEGRNGTQRGGCRNLREPIAECPVADPVVILDEGDEGQRRQRRARLPARPSAIGHELALKAEPFRQRTSKLQPVPDVVRVVPGTLAGCGHVQHMMQVIIPLRREVQGNAPPVTHQPAGLVCLILENQMRPWECGAHPLRQLIQQMRVTVVVQCVHGIDAQPVEMEFAKPVQCIGDDELPYFAAVGSIVVEGRTPGCLAPLRKELRRVPPQIITLRPEVVVDHIQKHHQAPGVRRVDQPFEVIGTTV